MNVYTNTTFEGHWPVGTAAVIVAKTAKQAAEQLNNKLEARGLLQEVPVKADEMFLISTRSPSVYILASGNY